MCVDAILRALFIRAAYALIDFASTKPMVGENVRQARVGEFPFVVAIKEKHNSTIKPEDARICTGALVSAFHVLTAAHCLNEIPLSATEIIVGSVDIRQGTKHYPLWWVDYNRWANHSADYRRHRINDIGIIKLTEAANQNIVPGDPSVVPTMYVYGTDVTGAGWGVANDGSNPRYLETVGLKVLSNDQCTERLNRLTGKNIRLPTELMCSIAEPYALLIAGDSGCPIFADNIIVGVHKSTMPFPDQQIHPDKINIHTPVYPYREFITSVMNGGDVWV